MTESFETAEGIRILAIQGSVRPGNYTAYAMALVLDELRRQEQVASMLIDPATLDLPLPSTAGDPDPGEPLRKLVQASSGLVLATPEYHGSYSSVIKLVIENLGFPSTLSGKPIALLGVAAGQIGAIKALEHLRSVLSHVGAIVLPGPVSIAGVRGVFDEQGRCLDAKLEQRIRGVATSLLDYLRRHVCPGRALESIVREKTG